MQSLTSVFQFLINIYPEESCWIWGYYHCLKVNIFTWKCGFLSLPAISRTDFHARSGQWFPLCYRAVPHTHLRINTFKSHWSSQHNQKIWGKASLKKIKESQLEGVFAQPQPLPLGTEKSVPRQALPLGTRLKNPLVVSLWWVENEWLSTWPLGRLKMYHWPLLQVSRPGTILHAPPALGWWGWVEFLLHFSACLY